MLLFWPWCEGRRKKSRHHDPKWTARLTPSIVVDISTAEPVQIQRRKTARSFRKFMGRVRHAKPSVAFMLSASRHDADIGHLQPRLPSDDMIPKRRANSNVNDMRSI